MHHLFKVCYLHPPTRLTVWVVMAAAGYLLRDKQRIQKHRHELTKGEGRSCARHRIYASVLITPPCWHDSWQISLHMWLWGNLRMSSGPTYIYLPLLFSLRPECVALRWRLALFPGCTAATRWVIYSWMTQMPHISTWPDPRLETPVPGRPTMGGKLLPGEQGYVEDVLRVSNKQRAHERTSPADRGTPATQLNSWPTEGPHLWATEAAAQPNG